MRKAEIVKRTDERRGDRATTVRFSAWPSVPAKPRYRPRRALRTVVLRKILFHKRGRSALTNHTILLVSWTKLERCFALYNILFSRENMTETTFSIRSVRGHFFYLISCLFDFCAVKFPFLIVLKVFNIRFFFAFGKGVYLFHFLNFLKPLT